MHVKQHILTLPLPSHTTDDRQISPCHPKYRGCHSLLTHTLLATSGELADPQIYISTSFHKNVLDTSTCKYSNGLLSRQYFDGRHVIGKLTGGCFRKRANILYATALIIIQKEWVQELTTCVLLAEYTVYIGWIGKNKITTVKPRHSKQINCLCIFLYENVLFPE